jgi:hypothetical protein
VLVTKTLRPKATGAFSVPLAARSVKSGRTQTGVAGPSVGSTIRLRCGSALSVIATYS